MRRHFPVQNFRWANRRKQRKLNVKRGKISLLDWDVLYAICADGPVGSTYQAARRKGHLPY